MTADVRLNKAKIARQCACKGWLIGFEQPHANNAPTVEAHQQTEAHRSWDLEEWQERNTAKGEVPIAVLRKVG